MTRCCELQLRSLRCIVALAMVLTLDGISCRPAIADEVADVRLHRVTFVDSMDTPRTIEARVLIEAQDGGLLLEARDGRLWNVTPKQLQKREVTEEKFALLRGTDLGQHLRQEMQSLGFEAPLMIRTEHYEIVGTAELKYAEWVGELLERLHQGFFQFWKNSPLKLHNPEAQLPVIVLKNQIEFSTFATKHDGPDAAQSQGYYSIPTNRIVLFDLTAAANAPQPRSAADIRNRIAMSSFNVATIVHEATHQIAFNCGLHTRYADNPMWLTEGMAMFFEVPDLDNGTGWKTIGQPNRPRLKDYRAALPPPRKPTPLPSLIRDDDRFQNAESARVAYAEAWALTSFLIKTRRTDYVAYLQAIQSKPRLIADEPDKRLREFQAAFGDDLAKLEHEFRGWALRQLK